MEEKVKVNQVQVTLVMLVQVAQDPVLDQQIMEDKAKVQDQLALIIQLQVAEVMKEKVKVNRDQILDLEMQLQVALDLVPVLAMQL